MDSDLAAPDMFEYLSENATGRDAKGRIWNSLTI